MGNKWIKLTLLAAIIVVLLSASFVISAYEKRPKETVEVVKDGVDFKIDGMSKDIGSFLYQGRTYVKVRELAEELGYEVSWDAETGTVILEQEKEVLSLLDTDYLPKSEKEEDWVMEKRKNSGIHEKKLEDRTVYMIVEGPQARPGYEIKVQDIKEVGKDKAQVYYSIEKEEELEKFDTELQKYPCKLIAVLDIDISLEFFNVTRRFTF